MKNYLLLRSMHSEEFYPDEVCRKTTPRQKHNPPLLYNLELDPGERSKLPVNEYADVLKKIDKVHYFIEII